MTNSKRILRGIGGLILILAGVFCGLILYSKSGGLDGLSNFHFQRILEDNLILAIGYLLLMFLGVNLAHTGSRSHFFLGLLLAFVAQAVAFGIDLQGETRQFLPWMIGVLVVAIASVVTASLGRKQV
jgi:hypothetical protein